MEHSMLSRSYLAKRYVEETGSAAPCSEQLVAALKEWDRKKGDPFWKEKIMRGKTKPEIIKELSADLREVLLEGLAKSQLDDLSYGIRMGQEEVLLKAILLLRPDYDVDRDRPRECHAPDCDKIFFPASRGHGQLYHSTTCRSRHNMQKRKRNEMN